MNKKVAIYAHRGASGYAFENTFEAYNKALVLGADGIEIDIQRSMDQQYFVFHDADFVRLAGINRLITECRADEILGFRLGKGFLNRFSNKRVPTFDAVLQWANERQVPLNIELKETLIGNMDGLITLLGQYPLPAGSHTSSFFEELLMEMKQRVPNIPTALIVTKKFDWSELPSMTHIDAVHAHKKYYKRRFLKAVEIAQKPIRFYGIEGDELFLSNPHPSVDAWITDYPDKVTKAMQ